MPTLDSVREDERSRMILKLLEKSDNGRASTREIREQTGLNSDKIHYQYRKLESVGLIKFEYDSSLTSDGEPPMRIAILTDFGEEHISKGIAGDVVVGKSYEQTLEELRTEWNDFRSQWDSFQDWADDVDERLDSLEDELKDNNTSSTDETEDEFDW